MFKKFFLEADKEIPSVIDHGYVIPFITKPPCYSIKNKKSFKKIGIC